MKKWIVFLTGSMLSVARSLAAQPAAPAQPAPEKEKAEIRVLQAAQQAELAKKDAEVAKAQAAAESTTARAEADQAKTEANQANSAAKETQASLDLAKSGKLMSSGITAGVALAIQTRAPWGDHEQRGTDTVAMPYLMVLPGYFGAPQPTREYCASSWGVGDDAGATAAATGAARKVARKVLDAIKADLSIGMSDEEVVKAWFPDADENQRTNVAAINIVRTTRDAINKQKDPKTKQAGEVIEENALDSLTARAWNPTRRGRCGLKSVGLWLGRPLSYRTSTKVDGVTADRELKPVIAFGAGYTPHAYFSVLAGFTLATVKKTEDAASSETAWATTIAVGGNLDLVGSLFK